MLSGGATVELMSLFVVVNVDEWDEIINAIISFLS